MIDDPRMLKKILNSVYCKNQFTWKWVTIRRGGFPGRITPGLTLPGMIKRLVFRALSGSCN